VKRRMGRKMIAQSVELCRLGVKSGAGMSHTGLDGQFSRSNMEIPKIGLVVGQMYVLERRQRRQHLKVNIRLLDNSGASRLF
jgi:hypothetical protein